MLAAGQAFYCHDSAIGMLRLSRAQFAADQHVVHVTFDICAAWHVALGANEFPRGIMPRRNSSSNLGVYSSRQRESGTFLLHDCRNIGFNSLRSIDGHKGLLYLVDIHAGTLDLRYPRCLAMPSKLTNMLASDSHRVVAARWAQAADLLRDCGILAHSGAATAIPVGRWSYAGYTMVPVPNGTGQRLAAVARFLWSADRKCASDTGATY